MRPEFGAGQVANDPEQAILPIPAGEVECDEQLGGLLKHYYRKAA